MTGLFKSLWSESSAPGAAAPLWWDWALVLALISLGLVEALWRAELQWRLFAVALCAALALTLPWRRTWPLHMVAVAFGSMAAVQIFSTVRGVAWSGLDTTLFLLILPYALLRWASGREIVGGLAMIALAFATAVSSTQGFMEGIGAGLFLLFPAALGLSVRYRDSVQRHSLAQARLMERERLARDLHDTVAHHVSAIAVQAQAGRAVAETRPDAPLDALRIIEEAASRTLVEMRHIVRTLRTDHQQAHTSASVVTGLERLAREHTSALHIDLNCTGALDDLDATLGATLHQLTRESITNVVRHARGAQVVHIKLTGEVMRVQLRITNDGQVVGLYEGSGFGLRGMGERVALLGGTLHAGPANPSGWCVEATLPKRCVGP